MASKKRKKHKRHLFISDTQVKPGVKLDHLAWAGRYIADKKPDVIVLGGDWFDMESLSSYDRGKKAAEGRRYRYDIAAGNRGLEMFMEPWYDIKGYEPRQVALLGNHEQRIMRHINANPELEGAIGYDDFDFEDWGWEVYDFLVPVVIDGIAYCHFFPQNAHGEVMQGKNGAPSASAQVKRVGMSCTAGHRQGMDYHIQGSIGGRRHGLISGSFYQHDEHYKGPMGNDHWRGIIMKNRVKDGDYDICPVSLDYLKDNYR